MHILKIIPAALTATFLTATFVAAGAAFAGGNLTPGTTLVPTDAGAVLTSSPVLASDLVPFSSPLGAKHPYSGQLGSFVMNEGAANPLGGLTFLFGIANDSTSTVPLASVAANGFAGYDTSVYYDAPDQGNFAPSSAHRTLDGDTVKFAFLDSNGEDAIAPGGFTYLVVVRTNAHTFTTILDGISDGVETNAPSFSPAPVPEASTTVSLGLLLVLGTAGVAAGKRRRKASLPL